MHLGFNAASAVVSAPVSPHSAAQISLCADRVVPGNSSGARRFPGFGVFAWWNHRVGVSGSNGFVAFARVVCSVCGDTTDVMVGRNLVQEIGQDGRITDVAACDFDRPYLQRFLVNSDVNLAPDTSLGAAMLTGIPLTFALCFDACAIDQEVLRTCSTAIWQAYVQRSLTTAKGAEVWHRPIQPDELQQALHKTCGLSQRQSEQHFQSETGLDRSITEILLPTTLAARWWYPNHLRIKQIDSEPRRFKLSLYDDQIVVLYLVGINCF